MLNVLNLLPGLYFFAVMAAGVFVLDRWYDPLPRRPLAVFSLLILIFFGPALFGGGIMLPLDNLRATPPFKDLAPSPTPGFVLQADQLEDFAPYFSEVRRHLSNGEWPLMNPRVGAGEPLLVNSQAQHFHPLMILTYPFPMSAAVGLVAAFKVLLALVFTFLLFRYLGLGENASLFGSVAYGLGGFMVLYLGWPQTQSAAFLPMMLYGLARTIDRVSMRELVLVAVATSGILLAGHPETMLYAVAMSGLFALARWWHKPVQQKKQAAVALALTGGAVFLIASPVLLPTFLYGKQSERYEIVEIRRKNLINTQDKAREQLVTDGVVKAVEDVKKRAVPVFAPVAFGSHRYGPYWGSTTIFQDASAFVGTAVLLCALLGLWPVGAGRRFAGERLMMGVGAVCMIIFVQPPGTRTLLAAVPIIGHSASYHRRLSLLLCLCLAYLAACAFERWARDGLSRRQILITAGGLALAVGWAYLAHPLERNPEALAAYRGLWLQMQVLAVLIAAVLLFQGRSARLWAPWTLVLLAAAELCVLHGDLNPTMPQRLYFPNRPSIEFLQQNQGDDRMVALGPNFRHNLPVIYGVNDLRSGNPLQPAKVMRLTRPVRESVFGRRMTVANHRIYDLFGVRYIAVRPGETFGRPLQLVHRGEMWIYERPTALSRLFWPAAGQALEDEAWPKAVWEINDYSKMAYFSGAAPSGAESWKAKDGPPVWDELSIEAAHIRARANCNEPRLLATSIYQDGGWRVLADRQPVPRTLTNGAFVGAWVGAGDGVIDLIYRPPGFLLGCLIAALASAGVLAAAAFFSIPASRRSRRDALDGESS